MPNNIQIRGTQIKDATIAPGKVDLTSTWDFSSGVLQAATPSNNSDVATKSYVDGLVADGFQAGDGIDIDTATSPDTISVLTASDGALFFVGASTNELSLKLEANKGLTKSANGLATQLKAETGGTISVDASGLYIADSAIANAKLANSTISGKSLGASLDALSNGNGIATLSYDGSAVKSVAVQPDVSDATIAVTSSGVKVADSSIKAAKLNISSYLDKFSGDGSTTAFTLSQPVPTIFAYIQVFKNGLLMEQVASGAANSDEFVLSPTGGASGEGLVTFGAAPTSGDLIRVWYLAD